MTKSGRGLPHSKTRPRTPNGFGVPESSAALAIFWLTTLSSHAEPWDGYRNRLVPDPAPITRQDFGYRDGKIGGWIQRSTTPAWYAKVIQPVTLEQPLSVSGTFMVRRSEGGSGVLFGWFNAQSRG